MAEFKVHFHFYSGRELGWLTTRLRQANNPTRAWLRRLQLEVNPGQNCSIYGSLQDPAQVTWAKKQEKMIWAGAEHEADSNILEITGGPDGNAELVAVILHTLIYKYRTPLFGPWCFTSSETEKIGKDELPGGRLWAVNYHGWTSVSTWDTEVKVEAERRLKEKAAMNEIHIPHLPVAKAL